MPLPQILEEDVQRLDDSLAELLTSSEASTALLIDKGGFLITQSGDLGDCDMTTLAALAAGSYAATQMLAALVHETNFNSIYQQGQNYSLLVLNVDDQSLLVIIFKAQISVGIVKYYAAAAVNRLAGHFAVARERDPGAGVDLSELNLEDTAEFFRRKRPASAEVTGEK